MKVSISLGLTVNLGNGEFVKPHVGFVELDLDKNLDEQIEKANSAIELANRHIFNALIARLDSLGVDRNITLTDISIAAQVEE